jgi:hypothetical protein
MPVLLSASLGCGSSIQFTGINSLDVENGSAGSISIVVFVKTGPVQIKIDDPAQGRLFERMKESVRQTLND